MAIHTAEAQDVDIRIEDAAAATEALARKYFGDAAYLRRDIHVDRETGEEQTVFEVHYCIEDPENDFDRLVSLDQALMDAFVRSVTPDVLSRVILTAIPTDESRSEEVGEAATHTPAAHDIERKIADAAAATETLARQYFGDAAYLLRDIHVDRETGRPQTVFEVHYCFPDPETNFDRLAAQHTAFTNAFARTMTPDVLCRITLMAIPSDAD